MSARRTPVPTSYLFVGLPTPANLTSMFGRHEFLDVSTHDVCFKHREIFI
jgi:hypothetical protein